MAKWRFLIRRYRFGRIGFSLLTKAVTLEAGTRWLETAHAGFTNMRGMGLPRPGEALQTVSRPFDKTRDGFVLGEGGGVVVVESLAHALERGATPIAEVIGGALTADAFHISAPEPSGRGQARARSLPMYFESMTM